MPQPTWREMTKPDAGDPADLMRRLSRKIEQHKAIQLTPADLDLLVISGAYEALVSHATEYLMRVSVSRLEQSERK